MRNGSWKNSAHGNGVGLKAIITYKVEGWGGLIPFLPSYRHLFKLRFRGGRVYAAGTKRFDYLQHLARVHRKKKSTSAANADKHVAAGDVE